MSDSDHNELLLEFTTVTGANEDRAKFYLESANWNIQVLWKNQNNKQNCQTKSCKSFARIVWL